MLVKEKPTKRDYTLVYSDYPGNLKEECDHKY